MENVTLLVKRFFPNCCLPSSVSQPFLSLIVKKPVKQSTETLKKKNEMN